MKAGLPKNLAINLQKTSLESATNPTWNLLMYSTRHTTPFLAPIPDFAPTAQVSL
jgi:hypothetical protein